MVSRNLSGRLHGRSGHIWSQTVLLEESGRLSFNITYPSHNGVQVSQYINKTTKSVYTGGTTNRSQTMGTVYRTGSSRRYTESHTADGHHSGALRTEVEKHVVHRKVFSEFSFTVSQSRQ